MRCATGLLVPNGRSRQCRYIAVNQALPLRRCSLHHRRPVECILIQDVPHALGSTQHSTRSSRVASKHSFARQFLPQVPSAPACSALPCCSSAPWRSSLGVPTVAQPASCFLGFEFQTRRPPSTQHPAPAHTTRLISISASASSNQRTAALQLPAKLTLARLASTVSA
jgi:hypothetical protein